MSNRGLHDQTFDQACEGLKTFYSMGIRSLAITGGEPFFWNSDGKNLDDVILEAREMRFRAISVYTNGTFPINTIADTVFVSIDGIPDTNDSLRGNKFTDVMNNIQDSDHKNIIINSSLNAKNKDQLNEFCDELLHHPKIKGVFFYFHTPYYGIDDLHITDEEKNALAKQLLDLKKQCYPILNSKAALKAFIRNDWQRPSDVCFTYANSKLYKCCRSISNYEACENCGYLGYLEVLQILKLKPSAILAGLNYIPSKRRVTK